MSKLGPHQIAWRIYGNLLNSSPVPTKAITSAFVTYLSSIITQKAFDKTAINQRRALKYALFSFIVTPVAHYWFKLLDELFPRSAEPETIVDEKAVSYPNLVKKVAIDQFLFSPFSIALFFIVQGLVERNGFKGSVGKVAQNFWNVQKKSWTIWPFAQFVNFLLVPRKYRILYMNLFGFFWNIVIQILSNKKNRLPISY